VQDGFQHTCRRERKRQLQLLVYNCKDGGLYQDADPRYGIVGFNVPLNTLYVISGTILRVRWPNQQCRTTMQTKPYTYKTKCSYKLKMLTIHLNVLKCHELEFCPNDRNHTDKFLYFLLLREFSFWIVLGLFLSSLLFTSSAALCRLNISLL